MRFEITFNEAVWQRQSELQFRRLYGKHIKQNQANAWIAAACFVAGMLFTLQQRWIGAVVLTTAFFYAYTFWRYVRHYAGIKENFAKAVRDVAAKFMAQPEKIVWTFLPDAFVYQDFRLTMRIQWSELTATTVVDGVLIVEFQQIPNTVFYLAEEEVGSTNFASILSFLQKVKNR